VWVLFKAKWFCNTLANESFRLHQVIAHRLPFFSLLCAYEIIFSHLTIKFKLQREIFYFYFLALLKLPPIFIFIIFFVRLFVYYFFIHSNHVRFSCWEFVLNMCERERGWKTTFVQFYMYKHTPKPNKTNKQQLTTISFSFTMLIKLNFHIILLRSFSFANLSTFVLHLHCFWSENYSNDTQRLVLLFDLSCLNLTMCK
jgi:hypothetical protein